MQKTLRSAVTFVGCGLHSGKEARMVVRPASADYGIWFKRIDVPLREAMIAACWDQVSPTLLCTSLCNSAGHHVKTVEHLMAALAGCEINNALIEIDGPEVPIMDGSAASFVSAFIAKGLVEQLASVRAIQVLRSVHAVNGNAIARLDPADQFEIDFSIDFEDSAIGKQHKHLIFSSGAFVRELSDCRTFCRQVDVEAMHAVGLALGGSFENAVVFGDDRVLNPSGLRRADEPVRHKMLDVVGDLYLAGCPIIGRYTGVRAGHALTYQLLSALFSDPTAWKMVDYGQFGDSGVRKTGFSQGSCLEEVA